MILTQDINGSLALQQHVHVIETMQRQLGLQKLTATASGWRAVGMVTSGVPTYSAACWFWSVLTRGGRWVEYVCGGQVWYATQLF